MDADRAHDWTVKEMADSLYLSPAHLHRLCLRHHDAPPMQIFVRLRMRRAEELLLSANYTLELIAARVGYRTPFAFSRAFKRHTGNSPKAFRGK